MSQINGASFQAWDSMWSSFIDVENETNNRLEDTLQRNLT